jgi:predicted NUDIX family NTP pyrophosphohydrolase
MVVSAGLLLYRSTPALEVFIGHMGGPFWARKDARAWSAPKGLVEGADGPLDTALREFAEEVGVPAPAVDYAPLGEFRYSSGKVVVLFAGAFAGAFAGPLVPVPGSPVTVEWPRGSGRSLTFPEMDRFEWCALESARSRLVAGQVPALDALVSLTGVAGG